MEPPFQHKLQHRREPPHGLIILTFGSYTLVVTATGTDGSMIPPSDLTVNGIPSAPLLSPIPPPQISTPANIDVASVDPENATISSKMIETMFLESHKPLR